MAAPVHDDAPSDSGPDHGSRPPTTTGDGGHRRRPGLQMILIALGAVAVLGIGLVAATRGTSEKPWAGQILPEAQPKPEFVLTGTDG
ncbi:MAG TPA: hypothetical protein PLZ72_14490, partial [Microthrixaceae bacterium]|nr:hypothetical protein [Microthrixaceae bacterium]